MRDHVCTTWQMEYHGMSLKCIQDSSILHAASWASVQAASNHQDQLTHEVMENGLLLISRETSCVGDWRAGRNGHLLHSNVLLLSQAGFNAVRKRTGGVRGTWASSLKPRAAPLQQQRWNGQPEKIEVARHVRELRNNTRNQRETHYWWFPHMYAPRLHGDPVLEVVETRH